MPARDQLNRQGKGGAVPTVDGDPGWMEEEGDLHRKGREKKATPSKPPRDRADAGQEKGGV